MSLKKNALTNVNALINTDWENVFTVNFTVDCKFLVTVLEKKCQFTSDIYFSLYIIRNT